MEVDPSNHVLYSNAAASLLSLKDYEKALEYANTCVELNPAFVKGYTRQGAALLGLEKLDEAEAAYGKALELDGANVAAKEGLDMVKSAKERGGKTSLFLDPQNLQKMMTDPRTRAFLSQPDFMSMLRECEENPQKMQEYMGKDERMKVVLEVLFGLRFADPDEMMGGDGSKGDAAAGETSVKEEKMEERMEAKDDVVSDEKKQSLEEKDKGNAAYKAKDFDVAVEHYQRAIALDPENISFLTNMAAVKFEQGKYEECIKDCKEAIERGRELRADYKLIARAMTRIGNSLVKQNKLEEAIDMYNKSLTEHRSADTLKRLNDTERALKKAQEDAYVDMGLCTEEKEKGNAAFKLQNYPEAVKHYSEALKRGPAGVNEEAYKLYSNRAACYTKLGAWNEGLKDAEKCIELAPEFGKGYSRKGHLQYFMKEYSKAMQTYEEGLKHDPESQELKDGLRRCIQAINGLNSGEMTDEERMQRQERAMADPEIQGILSDPIMRNVLREMEENPAAAQKHLSDPGIAKKFEKLIASGIVQVR
jgi:stress-induced-phosphoprotein 1